MKIKWIKIKKDQLDELKRKAEQNLRDYWKLDEQYKALEIRFKEQQRERENVGEILSDEIRDLKLILAGTVCKDNPFVNKKDAEMRIIPEYPKEHHFITP